LFNRNSDIKEAMTGIPRWAVAEKLGVHENTIYRMLRKELTNKERQAILNAVKAAKKELTEVH
jgi:transposase